MGKYSDDPIWADVAPLLQEEAVPTPLAQINYPDDYVEAISYLRAVMAANEHSPRVIDLTADVIDMSPAHYTVWIYRAQTLKAINANLQAELDWLSPLSLKHLKNYQIWHHRQTIIDALGSWDTEPAFIAQMMLKDAKNYHVWSYRQWAVQRFRLWDDRQEMEYVEKLLDEDIRNNSAWNHRWYMTFGRPHGDPLADKVVVHRELSFAEEAVRKAPQNESPWNYIRALYSKSKGDAVLPINGLASFAREFAGLDGGEVRSSHALDLLAWARGKEKGGEEEANKALDMLVEKYDPIRANYWRYRKALVNSGQELVTAEA